MNNPEIICIGQAVIDCITREIEGDPFDPAATGKAKARSITLNIGGDAVNESFVLAGMGRSVGLVCCTGDDFAGHFLRGEAERRGVDTSRFTVMEGIQTPVADMFVFENGSRSSISSPATLLAGYTPDPGNMKGVRVVSLASLFRAPLDQPEAVCRLVKAAHESGAIVCADTKLPTFRKITLEDLEEVLPMIDYFFPNETEAAYYSGRDQIDEMGEELLRRGIRHVIIKAGEKGCRAYAEGERYVLPAEDVPVMDTTGAGDSLVAGFIDGLLRGLGMEDCCKAGLRTAAECVQHLGATV